MSRSQDARIMSKPVGEQLSSTTISDASTAMTSSTVDTSASKVSWTSCVFLCLWFVFGCKVLVCLTLLLYTNDSVFQARGFDPKLCHLEFKWGHLKSLVIDKKLPIQIIFLFSQTWSKTNSRKENVTRHLCCQNGVTSQKKIGNHWSSRLMLYFPAVTEPCVGAVWMISLFVLILVFRSCPQSHWSMVELESLLCPSYFLFIDQGIQLWLEHILHKDRRDRRLCLSLTKTYPTL